VATKVHDAVKTSISAKASSGAAAAAAASAVADPALLAENQLMKKQLEAAKQQIKAAEEAHEKLKSTSESKFFELKRNFEEDLLMKVGRKISPVDSFKKKKIFFFSLER